MFRTFQGWLALRSVILLSASRRSVTQPNFSCSETAPTQGTLKVFPDVILSNAYILLRPFFKLKDTLASDDVLDASNWELGTFDVIVVLFRTSFT